MTKTAVLAPPTTTDFTTLAEHLLDRMNEHEPLKTQFGALGIESACFCLADQFGTAMHEFSVGTHAHGSVYLEDEEAARKAATLTGVIAGRYSSREIRLPEVGRYAGAVRGMQHVISCRLVAVQPLSRMQGFVVEDLSELVAISFGCEIKRRLGIQEMPKELAMGHLSRYRSPSLPLFDPFL